MPIKPDTILQPRYVADFHCIGTDCEDTCCEGMGVVIDKGTYEKYRACSDPGLKPLMDLYVLPNEASRHDATFAMVVENDAKCPFLDGQKLCSIQVKLGEEYLSRTCATYPRSLNVVDGVMERSLYISCPEAARLVLLNPNPMQFGNVSVDAELRFNQFPELDTTDSSYTDKPYAHFEEIRRFIISTLQDGAYALWERLVIVGLFCDRLDRMASARQHDAVPALIAEYTSGLETGRYRAPLSQVVSRPKMLIEILIEFLDHRVKTEYTGRRFLECYAEFKSGIGYTEDADINTVAARFTDAAERDFRPFTDRHPRFLENYLVNYIFRTLFPFGPQKSLYFEQKSIMAEYRLLTLHYIMVRTLLVGVAAERGAQFSPGDAVKVVQSFSKSIEHDMPYLKMVNEALERNNLGAVQTLAVLIKG